jgi:hypothetical protein
MAMQGIANPPVSERIMSVQIRPGTPKQWPHRLAVRTLPFQGRDTDSNSVGATKNIILWTGSSEAERSAFNRDVEISKFSRFTN